MAHFVCGGHGWHYPVLVTDGAGAAFMADTATLSLAEGQPITI
jgi:hypothetical protein